MNRMSFIKKIDIYGENRLEKHTKVREACRGIIIKNDEILLTYEATTDQWFIPGGGLEEDDKSLKDCCVRELAEETGCVVMPKERFLTINEYYSEWLFVSHYYICDCVGKTERHLTEREAEVGLEPRWIPLSKAIEIFSKHQDYVEKNEMTSGAYLREYKALLAYMEGR